MNAKRSSACYLTLCFLLYSQICLGQHNLRRTLSNEFSGLGSNWNVTNLDEEVNMDGTPNLFQSWVSGDLYFTSGGNLESVRCNYNANSHVFMMADVINHQILEVEGAEFDKFVYEKDGRKYVVLKGEKSQFDKVKMDFFAYELVYKSDDLEIARLTKKDLKVAGEFARVEYRADSWLTSESYYYRAKGNKFKKFKVSKRSMSSFMPPELMSRLNDHIKTNDDIFWYSKKKIMEFVESLQPSSD